MNTSKRIWAMILAICLSITLLPVTALAASGLQITTPAPAFIEGDTSTVSRQAVTVLGASSIGTSIGNSGSTSPVQVTWSLTGAQAGKFALYDSLTATTPMASAPTTLTTVYAGVASGATLTASDGATVTVSDFSGSASTPITVLPISKDIIKGTAYLYADGGKNTLSNASISAYTISGRYISSTSTKSDGTFSISVPSHLQGMEYQVYAHSNYILDRLRLNKDETALESGYRTVTAAESSSGLSFAFVNSPKVTGTVVDAYSGAVLADASVSVWDSVKTDAHGRFEGQSYISSVGQTSVYIYAYATGYMGSSKNHPVTVTIDLLKSGAAIHVGNIPLTPYNTGGVFGDLSRNYLSLVPNHVNNSSISNATVNIYADTDSTLVSAKVNVSASDGAEIQVEDANYIWALKEGKKIDVKDVIVSADRSQMTILMDIEPRQQYKITFGVKAPPVGGGITSYDVKADVNGNVVGKQTAIINNLNITVPAQVSPNATFNVFGEVLSSSDTTVKLVIKNPLDQVVYSGTSKSQGFFYRFNGIKMSGNVVPGQYTAEATATYLGNPIATASATMDVVDTPLIITYMDLEDDFGGVTAVNPPMGGLLTFIGWVDDSMWSMDYRHLRSTVKVNDSSNIQSARFVMNTSHGTFNWPASQNGNGYSAYLSRYQGTGKATVSIEFTMKDGTLHTYTLGKIIILIDPSGYVYDTTTGKPIQGATVTLYEKNSAGSWVLWNAEDYMQINPQKTDDQGRYGWMVTEGDYEVRVTAPGYHPATTSDPGGYGRINVLPARMDVNIGLTPIGSGSTPDPTPPTPNLPNIVSRPRSSSGSGSGSTGSSVRDGSLSGSTTVTASIAPSLTVDAAKASAALKAQASSGRSRAIIRHAGSIKVLAAAFKTFGNTPVDFDTLSGKSVDVRITVSNPGKITSDMLLSGSTSGTQVQKVKAHFGKWFQGQVQVIHLDQPGSWGQPVEVAAKVNLEGMNLKNLHFYSYDQATNSFKSIANPKYFMDTNGYLHFTTEYAGDIVISNGPLVRR